MFDLTRNNMNNLYFPPDIKRNLKELRGKTITVPTIEELEDILKNNKIKFKTLNQGFEIKQKKDKDKSIKVFKETFSNLNSSLSKYEVNMFTNLYFTILDSGSDSLYITLYK